MVVVLDDSGSMDKNIESGRKKMAAAKESLSQVLRSLSRDTKVGILALNSRVANSNWIVPVGSPDPGRWEAELHQVRAKGGTPLGESMRIAADELLKLRAQAPYDTYRLLVVTDGEATDAACSIVSCRIDVARLECRCDRCGDEGSPHPG